MSLERQDLRLKLNAEHHSMLSLLAEAEGIGLAELAERILVPELVHRVHAAMVIAAKAQRLGLTGIQPGNRE